MGLELVLTEAQLALIKNSARSNRGYIFVQEKEGRLVATKVVLAAKKSDELILLSELPGMDSAICPDEVGYIPYIHGRSKNHERCALDWHHMNRKIDRHASELGISGFTNKFKGYGIIEGDPKFYRFVGEGIMTIEEVSFKICEENEE